LKYFPPPSNILFILKNIEVESFTLLGHGKGGNTCLLFASLFPDKVKKLVLVNALGHMPDLSNSSSASPSSEENTDFVKAVSNFVKMDYLDTISKQAIAQRYSALQRPSLDMANTSQSTIKAVPNNQRKYAETTLHELIQPSIVVMDRPVYKDIASSIGNRPPGSVSTSIAMRGLRIVPTRQDRSLDGTIDFLIPSFCWGGDIHRIKFHSNLNGDADIALDLIGRLKMECVLVVGKEWERHLGIEIVKARLDAFERRGEGSTRIVSVDGGDYFLHFQRIGLLVERVFEK
jgi:pimeloyl-ACP methyl ester carboxylesterase